MHCLWLTAHPSAANTRPTAPPQDYADAPARLWLAAAISALPIVGFFYFDQNLSSLLTQQPYMYLRFGSFYHSSFFGNPCPPPQPPPLLPLPLSVLSTRCRAARARRHRTLRFGSAAVRLSVLRVLAVPAAMGLFNFIGPSFGLPFVTGSLPHSPQMVKALTNYRKKDDNTFEVTGVSENRIAPFLMYLLIGLPILKPEWLAHIPSGALNGV